MVPSKCPTAIVFEKTFPPLIGNEENICLGRPPQKAAPTTAANLVGSGAGILGGNL
jgi:hypothetical protein